MAGWWDDDDDYWNFKDKDFLEQVDGLEKNREHVRTIKRTTVYTSADWFLATLEIVVYLIGAFFALLGVYAAWRWKNGQSVPFLAAFNQAFNPDGSGGDLEGAAMKRMAITPDVIRT